MSTEPCSSASQPDGPSTSSPMDHPNNKPCTLCGRRQPVLVRCQIDETGTWHFVCAGRCWKSVSGGVEDARGREDEFPLYRYGGMCASPFCSRPKAYTGKAADATGKKVMHSASLAVSDSLAMSLTENRMYRQERTSTPSSAPRNGNRNGNAWMDVVQPSLERSDLLMAPARTQIGPPRTRKRKRKRNAIGGAHRRGTRATTGSRSTRRSGSAVGRTSVDPSLTVSAGLVRIQVTVLERG